MIKGKVIDQIEVEYNNTTIRVPLRLIKLGSGLFKYKAVWESPKIEFEDLDPNKVRQHVIDQIKTRMQTKWTPIIRIQSDVKVLHISISYGEETDWGEIGDPITLAGGRGLEVSVVRLEIGVLDNGTTVYRELPPLPDDPERSRYMRRSHEPRPGMPSGLDYKDGQIVIEEGKAGEGYSWLPDTEENQAKLRSILTAIDVLGKQLRMLLSPDHIIKTLANTKLLGLPAPDSAPGSAMIQEQQKTRRRPVGQGS